jgi:hypothetical protein
MQGSRIANTITTNKGARTMTNAQRKELLNYLNIYKGDLITNMTDAKIYQDPWQQSDINKLNKHLRLIKKLIKGAN